MEYQSISIQVPADIAKAYEKASDEKRQIAVSLFSGFLKPRDRKAAVKRLKGTCDRLSAQAKESGLTQEIVDEIISDEA